MSEDKFALGRLLVRQKSPQTHLSLVGNQYDLVLCAVSWESRCTYAMRSVGLRFPKLYAFRFETTDREIHSKKSSFVQEFQSIADEFKEVQLGKSISYPDNVRVLDEFLSNRTAELGRPLRVLCDITCLPKSHLLVILGMGFEKGYFARIDCLYSEGDYSGVKHLIRADGIVASEEGSISEGKWDSLSIPFFEANAPIPSSRDVLVTLGGEVGLVVPFIEKYEPMRLGIIAIRDAKVGSPEALGEILNEPNVVRRNIAICDVLGVARQAMEFCGKSTADVVTALAVGSKPHALGLGVAALDQPKMEIVCRVPKRYTMLDIPANGTLTLYEIEDRFEPHAYFQCS